MPRPTTFHSASVAQTKVLGKNFGKNIRTGAILALAGPFGGGKTTFVQGLASGVRLGRKIVSPTFVKMASYAIPNTDRRFYHLDLFHLRSRSEFRELGLSEILKNTRDIVIIEWPEKVKAWLPPRTHWIHFAHDPKNAKTRIIQIR